MLSQWMRRGVCLLFVCSKKNLNFICFYILSVYSFVFWMMSDIQTSTLHCISTNIFVKSIDYIYSNDKIYLLKVQIIFVQMTNNSWCGRQTALCLLCSGLVLASANYKTNEQIGNLKSRNTKIQNYRNTKYRQTIPCCICYALVWLRPLAPITKLMSNLEFASIFY